jgi:excisionase family DNA binding protein
MLRFHKTFMLSVIKVAKSLKNKTIHCLLRFLLYTPVIKPMRCAGCNDFRGLITMGKDMTKRKDVLTTGQVAQICNVAPRTVTKWFDTGKLKGYRIPGSRDRRIPASELIRFMRAHDIPTGMLEVGKLKVLIIDDNQENAANLAAVLAERANYEVELAHNGFDAGVLAHRFTPHAVLINLFSSTIDAGQICKNIRTSTDLVGTKVIAVGERLSESETAALLRKGFDGVFSKNGDMNQIVKVIEDATAMLY